MRVGVVVEGHGDGAAVPVLLRRLALKLGHSEPEILQPHRIPKSKMIKSGELERVIELVARKAGPAAPIVVIADADDDCPAILGPALLARIRAQRSDRECAVILATKEFEAWFLAAALSLAGHRSLPTTLTVPVDPEQVSGAKEVLAKWMLNGYSETLDQPAFAAMMDLDQALVLPSFRKFYRDIDRILRS